MRIKEIGINNFHCYRQTTFQFADRVTILIGKNGSGKSSLIKGIKNALSVFFSNNSSWGYQTIVGSVNELSVANLSSREIWHDNDMKPAELVDIEITAERMNYDNGLPEGIPSWSFRKYSTPKAKLQNSYYKDAYKYFRENYTDNTAWPLFVYYSDRYPHIDDYLSDSIKQMIDNDEKLYRAWGYYHWDKDSSCALIWQKRFIRIYNLLFRRQQTLNRIVDKESEEAKALLNSISLDIAAIYVQLYGYYGQLRNMNTDQLKQNLDEMENYLPLESSLEVTDLKAKLSLMTKDYQEANDYADKVIYSKESPSADILLIKAIVLSNQGQNQEALDYINKARKHEDANSEPIVSFEENTLIENCHQILIGTGMLYPCYRILDIDINYMGKVEGFNGAKHHLLPIPQSAMDKDPNLQQNPNYQF